MNHNDARMRIAYICDRKQYPPCAIHASALLVHIYNGASVTASHIERNFFHGYKNVFGGHSKTGAMMKLIYTYIYMYIRAECVLWRSFLAFTTDKPPRVFEL